MTQQGLPSDFTLQCDPFDFYRDYPHNDGFRHDLHQKWYEECMKQSPNLSQPMKLLDSAQQLDASFRLKVTDIVRAFQHKCQNHNVLRWNNLKRILVDSFSRQKSHVLDQIVPRVQEDLQVYRMMLRDKSRIKSHPAIREAMNQCQTTWQRVCTPYTDVPEVTEAVLDRCKGSVYFVLYVCFACASLTDPHFKHRVPRDIEFVMCPAIYFSKQCPAAYGSDLFWEPVESIVTQLFPAVH